MSSQCPLHTSQVTTIQTMIVSQLRRIRRDIWSFLLSSDPASLAGIFLWLDFVWKVGSLLSPVSIWWQQVSPGDNCAQTRIFPFCGQGWVNTQCTLCDDVMLLQPRSNNRGQGGGVSGLVSQERPGWAIVRLESRLFSKRSMDCHL